MKNTTQKLCELVPSAKAGQNLQCQLSKSGTASALIYREAQSAESKAGFIHKIKLVLKEIRASRVNLKMIRRKRVIVHEKIERAFDEATRLMAIFLKGTEIIKMNNLRP